MGAASETSDAGETPESERADGPPVRLALVHARARAGDTAAPDDPEAAPPTPREDVFPPLGVTTLAGALLARGGYEVRIVDDGLQPLEEVEDAMAWAEVVAISASSPDARRARELGEMSRRRFGRLTLIGGPHATSCPGYFLESGAADLCVLGPGEETLPAVVERRDDRREWARLPGVCFLEDGRRVETAPRHPTGPLDEAPAPAYHLLDVPAYFARMATPGLPLQTSRGCPHGCVFCDPAMTPAAFRALSPARAVDLVEQLVVDHDPPHLYLADDLFTVDRERALAFCRELVARGLAVKWSCEGRADTMDLELLRWMRRAGCVQVRYGLESGAPDARLTGKQDVSAEAVTAGALLTREVGIECVFVVLYGFPHETVAMHRVAEDLVAEARPDRLLVDLLVPLPGTAVYEEVEASLTDDVTETEYDAWGRRPTWDHPTLGHDQLQRERARLLEIHGRATGTARHRWLRRWERLRARLRHPVLLLDGLDILRRRALQGRRLAKRRAAGGRTPPRVQLPLPNVRT